MRKLLPAFAMLTVSAISLTSATYAWFTMNKTVKVTGMEMKAHAEEGLLINEEALATSAYWDEEAKAGDTEFVALRPASTSNLSNWWHANSLNMDKEAGLSTSGSVEAYTAKINDSDYYANIGSGSSIANSHRPATPGSVAERYIYYADASFGSGTGSYDNGEGFYVNYKYYIKSSSSDGMSVDKSKFMVKATATQKNSGQSGTDLDKAIRVGVKIDDDILIFAPNNGDTNYKVTKNVTGAAYDEVTAYTTETALGSTGKISIPKVTETGKLVDVYVWFEGEDQNCKSKNLTETLNDYQIDLTLRIDELVG